MDASALRCPSCGAVVDPDARRCAYCRARLATISCPSCFALMFEGAAFCPHCGARRARVEADPSGARCPSCRNELRRVTLESASMLECGTCDGVWLDAAEFERVCAEREVRAAVLHRSSTSARSPAAQSVRYRPCLRCGKMMNRLNFGRVSGTIVDVCRGHGTFLESGELHAVVRFIQDGGLERTRAREIEDLKDEQRRLREMQAADVRRHPDGAGEHTRLTWTAADLSDLLDWMK